MKSLYTFTQAAEYLGLHTQTLERHQRDGRLTADYQFENGERAYTQETLDAYRRRWQSQMLTAEEIQDLFGITRETFWYHFRKKRNIQHDAKRGRAECFSDAKIMMIARTEKWITALREESIGNKILGIGLITHTARWIVYVRVQGELRVQGQYTREEAEATFARLSADLIQSGRPTR